MLDRQKNRKIFDWENHHQYYIEQWELLHDMDENNELHMNREYRRYQAWYQRATRCRLRLQWTEDDYADIESSDDEDTAYDQTTRVGRQVEAGPILDRVVSQLLYFVMLSCIPIIYLGFLIIGAPSSRSILIINLIMQHNHAFRRGLDGVWFLPFFRESVLFINQSFS